MKHWLILAWGEEKAEFRLTGSLNWPMIRECLEKTFPDWDRILTPLDDPKPLRPDSQIINVSIYESKSKSGEGRIGALHQWLVEVRRAA